MRCWILVGLSGDLRERVVAAVDAGMTQQRVAERFAVSLRSVERLPARRGATGSLAPAVQRHGPLPVERARLQAWLPGRWRPADATLAEHAAAFAAETGMRVSPATTCGAIAGLPAASAGAALTPRGRRRRAGRRLKQKA